MSIDLNPCSSAWRVESVRASEPLRRLHRTELRRIEHELPDGVDRRELQDRHVELLAPCPDGAKRLGREAVAVHRPRRRLPGRAEPHPLQREALHHELLLRQRLGVELEHDPVGLDEIPARLERIGHLQCAEIDGRLAGQEIEPPHVHLRAQQLGAHFLGGIAGHRLGEEDHEDADHEQQQEQRPDRLPAEDLDAHGQLGRKSLYQL